MYGFTMAMQVISHILKIKNLLVDWPTLVKVLKAKTRSIICFLWQIESMKISENYRKRLISPPKPRIHLKADSKEKISAL